MNDPKPPEPRHAMPRPVTGAGPGSVPPRVYATRRDFLRELGGGLGAVALATMLAEEQATAGFAPQPGHHVPRAQNVIQIFCAGGLSHIDTWDYKPELERRAGKPFDPTGELEFFASEPGATQPSYWTFRRYGQSGRWISDLFPRLGRHVDDLAFIHSMKSKTALHGPGCYMMNTGFVAPGFPAMGSWVTYGLGSVSQNLPAFVVLPDPRGLPPGGPINWGAGFLPGMHQGTALNTANPREPIADLKPDEQFDQITDANESKSRAFLRSLNERHRQARDAVASDLEARIAAYEMAARLQLSAPEATAIDDESETTRQMYALDHPEIGPFGRQCLLARRLVERGVRFVQVYCGAENTTSQQIRPNWDSHEDVPRDHGYWGPILDTGAAALLGDLKARGMLEQTLVICTTEFGRQPALEGGNGRDHNPATFTAWMAGGGIRGGVAYGQSDELGFEVAENPTYCYDLHATALHLLGIDHERLTYYHNGIERRLTDVHGHLIRDIMA